MQNMTIIIRQALTASLLLLFSSEHVALASTLSAESHVASHNHSFVQHGVHTLFNLLAEENEERDGKDDCGPALKREVLHPHHFPQLAIGKIPDHFGNAPFVRSLPIYTYHCTFLI